MGETPKTTLAQLFQVNNCDKIWLKINDYWAVAINTNVASSSLFEATTEVILLLPDSLDEEQ